VPYVGAAVTFAAGDLVDGETIHTWHASGPLSTAADWATARANLAAQMKGFRTALLIGDLQTEDNATDWLAQWDAYETSNERFVLGRCSVYDRLPQAALSVTSHQMTGNPNITFAEVGGTADTITRSAGSFVSDGFAPGDLITVTGAVASGGANNITTAAKIVTVTATVITLDDDDLENEGPIAGVSIVGRPSLTFADSGDTITRSRGSWLADGFREGDTVTITGTDSATNDGSFVVDTLTATVMTLEAGGVDADEVAPTSQVSITTGQTKAAWMAEIDAVFADIDDAPRINIAAGRARKRSPFSGWRFRRPPSWAAAIREFQHDIHIATWRKKDGATGWDLEDAEGNLVEWDDRVDGEAGTAARFTTFHTWANGPQGAFICQDLTRALDSSLLSKTNKAHVVNLTCSIVQLNSEDAAIGVDLILNSDGTATSDSLRTIEAQVNAVLELELLTDKKGEGRRASQVAWTIDTSVDYRVAEPEMLSTTELLLNGTVHKINNKVKLSVAGQ
jgi:hypothetical protein